MQTRVHFTRMCRRACGDALAMENCACLPGHLALAACHFRPLLKPLLDLCASARWCCTSRASYTCTMCAAMHRAAHNTLHAVAVLALSCVTPLHAFVWTAGGDEAVLVVQFRHMRTLSQMLPTRVWRCHCCVNSLSGNIPTLNP